MVAKTMPEGWIAYRLGTFLFFGANKEVMQYREFAGVRRNPELFEAFVKRYQTLAHDNDLEWIVEVSALSPPQRHSGIIWPSRVMSTRNPS